MSIRTTMSMTFAAAVLLACGGGGAVDQVASDSTRFDIRSGDWPVVTLSETTDVAWTTGGFMANPDDEVSSRGGVTGLVSLPGSRYLLSEGARVRVFDSTGAETWRFGREGAGPEEFNAIGWPCAVQGDTVVVMDQRNQRFAVLAAELGVVKLIPADQRSLREEGCSGRGEFMVQRTVRDSSGGPGQVVAEMVDASGAILHEVPGGTTGSYSIVGLGYSTLAMVDTLVMIGNPNSGEIRLLTEGGEYVRSLVWGAPRVSITDDNIPERYGMSPAGLSPADMKAWWDKVRTRPRADNWPAFVQVRPDAAGRIWVMESFDREGGVRRWWVMSSTGQPLAQVQVPTSTRERILLMLGFVPDGIALYYEDADGAPHVSVVRYPKELR